MFFFVGWGGAGGKVILYLLSKVVSSFDLVSSGSPEFMDLCKSDKIYKLDISIFESTKSLLAAFPWI